MCVLNPEYQSLRGDTLMLRTSRWPIFVVILTVSHLLALAAIENIAYPGEAQTHHPAGWQFTLPKGDAAKGRAHRPDRKKLHEIN